MSHGLVALERDNRPGVGVWQFAMARGEFIAVYAPRQMESFHKAVGEVWRSTLVRALGEVRVGPFTEQYARYEPEYDEQFLDMYYTCAGTMGAAASDVTDDDAISVLDDFERHAALDIGRDRKPRWAPSLRLVSIGARWWYFPYFSDEIPFTIFLAPEMEMVSEVAERRSNVKGFEVLERW
jgi:hypothetical protein